LCGPFHIKEALTKVDVHFSYEEMSNEVDKGFSSHVLPEEEMSPMVKELLDYQEHEVHKQFVQAISSGLASYTALNAAAKVIKNNGAP
jgi:hypothetical protein